MSLTPLVQALSKLSPHTPTPVSVIVAEKVTVCAADDTSIDAGCTLTSLITGGVVSAEASVGPLGSAALASPGIRDSANAETMARRTARPTALVTRRFISPPRLRWSGIA